MFFFCVYTYTGIGCVVPQFAAWLLFQFDISFFSIVYFWNQVCLPIRSLLIQLDHGTFPGNTTRKQNMVLVNCGLQTLM